jgi:ribose 5-phosphate isomerase B
MRVYIGSDHAGFDLKGHLVPFLRAAGHDVIDVGAARYEPDDDYPVYCLHAAARVVADPGSLALVIGGSGNGEQIVANKVRGIRAALAWNEETARLARSHNDANVLSLGARMLTADAAVAIVAAFLTTPFSADARHVRRNAQIGDYEARGVLPPLPPLPSSPPASG